jgi:hypothetical protein
VSRTEWPPHPAGNRILNHVAAISGVLSLVIGVVAFAASDNSLVLPMLAVSAVALIATGSTGLTCGLNPTARRAEGRGELRMHSGFARLCLVAGAAQLGILTQSTQVAAGTGVFFGLCLLAAGTRRSVRGAPGGRQRQGRARAGTAVLAVIIVVLIVNSSLAVAVTISSNGAPSDGGTGGPAQPETETEGEGGGESVPTASVNRLPTYAELCPHLPDPRKIGHGLGQLFEEDDAIKAGCGTSAFQVPETTTWVAAGLCVGELRSVAVSSPNLPPVITYGQASEFIWAEAQAGELVAVEAASPGDGDVVLVETRRGTYGFARSKRSAVSGNPRARSCNRVGGVAEPFARIPPPLLVLWAELIHDDATWYWPTYDQDGETESVAFISTEGVDQGECSTDDLCSLDVSGTERTREGGEFTKLAALSEYMPTE